MTTDNRSRFSVITNNDIEQINQTPPDVGNKAYHTNPMYEKLMKYRMEQKQKRFTVEDLLKW